MSRAAVAACLLLAAFLVATAPHAARAQDDAAKPAGANAASDTAEDASSDSDPADEASDDAAGDRGDEGGLAYEVDYDGPGDDELKDFLREVSTLPEEAERLPATPAALRRRIHEDVERMAAALRSRGFYKYVITHEIDATSRPLVVHIHLEEGPEFLLGEYAIDYVGNRPVTRVPDGPSDVGLVLGMRARAAPIKDAERQLIQQLGRTGYPFATLRRTDYAIDKSRELLLATVTVDAGPAAAFGDLRVTGLDSVAESHVRKVAAWRTGEEYDERKLDRVRRDLAATGLFDTIVLTGDERPGDDGRVPVTLELRERDHRTVAVGIAATTGEEVVRGKFSWEHRNLLGKGEKLRLEAIGSLLRQELRADFTKPFFLRRDQKLKLDASFRNEDSDAFREKAAEFGADVERQVTRNLAISLGTAFELSEITDQAGTDNFVLLGLRGGLTYDNRDNILDPTEGVYLKLGLAPWVSVAGQSTQFLTTETSIATYWTPVEEGRVTLAARTRLGSIIGAAADNVPANKRFYAGGGGSVRGYEFRSISPLDPSGDPFGGASVIELGFEARIKITETIGVVPFLDGGQVYEDSMPDFARPIQWAAGLGLRYYTPIGPVRLDVAFPLNRRQGIDDFFQFYISLGQAF